MLFYVILLFFSVILLAQIATAQTVAQDGISAKPNSRLSAKHALLLLRQNIVYCAETYYSTYCTDSVCCGDYSCMPATAECCANGQYCLAGTTCEWQNDVMTCQCAVGTCNTNSSPGADPAVTATVTAPASSSPSTSAPPEPGSSSSGSDPTTGNTGYTVDQKIALGVGIGLGIPTLLVAILTLWHQCCRG